MKSNHSRPTCYIMVALLLPVLAYLVLVQVYAYNFPFLDDYATILQHALLSNAQQISNWFTLHNEHLHLVLKAAVSFDLWLFGTINLVHLIGLGAVIFLLFFWILLKLQTKEGLPWLWLNPLPFLLFQPSYWGTITWSTTSLHNFPGLLFSLLALLLWNSPENRNKYFALIFTCLALLTNGFGLSVLGTLILWECFNFLQNDKTKRPIPWSPFMGLVVVGIAWMLFRLSLGELPLQADTYGNSPTKYLHFLTNFLGSCFHFLGSPWLNMLAVTLTVGFLILTRKGLHKKHPILFYFIVYLLLSALLTTIARTDLGPKQGLASRYRIYSTLYLCSIYLGFAHLYWKKCRLHPWVLPSLFAISCVYYSLSLLVNINNLNKIKQRLIADEQRWHSGDHIQEFLNPRDAKLILDEADKAGVFPKTHSDK